MSLEGPKTRPRCSSRMVIKDGIVLKRIHFIIIFCFLFNCVFSQQTFTSSKFGEIEIGKSTFYDMKTYLGNNYVRDKDCETVYYSQKQFRQIVIEYSYKKNGVVIAFHKQKSRRFQGFLRNDKKFITISSISFIPPFSGCTDKGVKIGDSADLVIRQYGLAVVQNHALKYDNYGITFILDENNIRVVTIIIHGKDE